MIKLLEFIKKYFSNFYFIKIDDWVWDKQQKQYVIAIRIKFSRVRFNILIENIDTFTINNLHPYDCFLTGILQYCEEQKLIIAKTNVFLLDKKIKPYISLMALQLYNQTLLLKVGNGQESIHLSEILNHSTILSCVKGHDSLRIGYLCGEVLFREK